MVKLFNAIQQSQAAAAAKAEELKSHRGTGKPTLPAPIIDSNNNKGKSRKKGKQKDDVPLGCGCRSSVVFELKS